MKKLRVFDSALSSHQRQLVKVLHADVPPATIHIHYGVHWKQPSATGVTIPRSSRRPEDPQLAELWSAISDRTSGFLVVIGESALASDEELLITLGHELQHVRQEVDCHGILRLSETCLEFIKATPSLRAATPGCLHAPVNAHAEIAGAGRAIEILGSKRVRQYYESYRPHDIPVVQGILEGVSNNSADAVRDLVVFFRDHLAGFEAWCAKMTRPRLSSLKDVLDFINDPCSRSQKGTRRK